MDAKEELTTGNNTDKAVDLLRRRQEQEELLAEDERLGKLISDQRLDKGVGEEDEAEAERKIKEYLMTHNEGKEHNEYLVRGAELRCSCGSHTRKMNLNQCHGVYIKGHPAVHELDCVSGEGNHITCFGICDGEDFETEEAVVVGEDGKRRRGPKCEPKLVGIWRDSYDGTRIVDKGDKMQDDLENPIGCNTLTVGSFLVCQHGGIISPVNSGQDRTVEAEDFVDGWVPYREVVEFKDENEKGSLEEQLLRELAKDLEKNSNNLEDLTKDLFLDIGDLVYGGLAELSLPYIRRFLMGDMAEYIKNCRENRITFNKYDAMCIFGRNMIEYLRKDLPNMPTEFVEKLKTMYAKKIENGMQSRAEEYAARAVPNSLVLQAYELLCFEKLSKQQITDNKIHNSLVLTGEYIDEKKHFIYKPPKVSDEIKKSLLTKKDSEANYGILHKLVDGFNQAETGSGSEKNDVSSFFVPNEPIENQGDTKWENVHYGESNMHEAGCEIFAVYNARLSLGEEMDAGKLVELISIFETKGAASKGNYGTSPLAVYNYLKEKGYDVGATDSFQKEDINAIGEKYDTIIITSFNDQLTLERGVHTINISKGEEGYIAHNNYFRDANKKLAASPAVPTLWDAVLDLPKGKTKPIFIIGINKK